MKKIYVVMILLLMTVSSWAASGAAGPSVQITGYDVLPENIFPGMTGQLQLTLANSGTETATSTTIYYDYSIGKTSHVYVGGIGSGSQTITTVPFLVPEKVESGIIIVNIDVYYRDEDQIESKHSVSSIPVLISQHQILAVETLSLSSETISKGEPLTAELEITNTGGVMKNVIISVPENSSFSLEGTTWQHVGDIASNSSRIVSVDLISSSITSDGEHMIPVVITYNDALQNEIEETVYIGPVIVSGQSSQLRLSSEPVSDAEIGSQLLYNITVSNHGSTTQSATMTISGTDVLTPMGPNTIYIDDIAPGGSVSELIAIGVDAGAASGYYSLPLTLKVNGDEQEYEIGIGIHATPSITITSESESSETGSDVTIRIANTGNTVIRSMYVKAEPDDSFVISGSDAKFIGTLSVDDYATFQLSLSRLGQGSIPIVITFKDNDNVEHTVRENIDIGNAVASISDSEEETPQANWRGGPMGMSRDTQTENIPLYAGAGLLIFGGMYVGYRKLKSNKRKETEE